MATIKSYTDINQSRKLANKILPFESADMCYPLPYEDGDKPLLKQGGFGSTPCWSLAALLNILHSKTKDIPNLSGGGYRDGEYISDWCLDYEFEDGDYQKTFADNPIDVCYEMIIHLNELNLL